MFRVQGDLEGGVRYGECAECGKVANYARNKCRDCFWHGGPPANCGCWVCEQLEARVVALRIEASRDGGR